ncbi:MAG TPA: hypothetical protein VHN80_10985 [Kineosporiaceae bacterium]|nr:hypothetical protein [Kineosporiaceae bacterium]
MTTQLRTGQHPATQQTQQTAFTLVLGGTGKTGRRVVSRLTALGLPVRVGSRTGEPPFDWGDRSTWAPALRGVGAVYISYHPDLAFPGAAEQIRDLAATAVATGARRLVLLSGRGEEEAVVSEQGVRDAGVEWTILRSTWFSQDFSEHFLLEPVLEGVIALPGGAVAEPFIDLEDVADVAVAVLTGDGHGGQVYELTGPRLLTFADAAAEIGAATGRQIRYLPVSPGEYAAALTGYGMPQDDAAALAELFSRVLDGRNAYLTDGVQRVLGRQPRDFTDYVERAARAGAWSR